MNDKSIYPARCDYYECQATFRADAIPFVHWHLGFKSYYCNFNCAVKARELRVVG